MLCILLLFVIAVLISIPNLEGAGSVGDVLGAVTTIFGLRNNLLNVVFGISYERALFWHKVMGCCFIMVIVIHAFEGMNFSGIMMLVAMICMATTYFIKNMSIPHAFEIFYYLHLSCMLLLVVMGMLHGTPFIIISGGIWVLDVVLRSCSYAQSETIMAKATQLPGEVIKLTFERPITYHAGQYAFLRIPSVNSVEFHPFSFSSSPHEQTMTIHIRELGDWTRRLGDMVRANDKAGSSATSEGDKCVVPVSEGLHSQPLTLEVMVDGPYGNHMINLESVEYEVFILISGGIGITPNQSLYNKLIAQAEEGRALRKVFFVWSVKDKALVDSMSPDMLESSKVSTDLTPLSFQPSMSGMTKSSVVTPFASSGDTDAVDEKLVKSGDLIFENRFHLTSVRNEVDFKKANIDPVAQPWLTFGRPDIAAIFGEARALLKGRVGGEEKTPHVAVCVCGPTGMVSSVQDLCRLSRGDDVVFDCHAEVFDM